MKPVEHLVYLGQQLRDSNMLEQVIADASGKNPWFVSGFVRHSIEMVCSEMLDESKLNQWLSAYSETEVEKTVGLIFAGNIPLVGFHDFLCAYVAGCKMKIKLSSKDDNLFPFLISLLTESDTTLKQKITFTDTLKNFDAVVATGSNNSNRYFEYYFRGYPSLLRKNRNSIAILTGEESTDELESLADDVFTYFGLGCRNVSKLYVPVGYKFDNLFKAFEKKYSWMHEHTKYMNNYDFNRSVFLLNKTPHLANEFIMLIENPLIPSSIATLNFEYWHDERVVASHLRKESERIQCVVSGSPAHWPHFSSLNFGQTQKPSLRDYADGADTLQFLLDLK